MITLTRSQVRRLRQVFRRSILGISHKAAIPPLVLRAEGAQLRAQHRYRDLAVEHAEPGSYRPAMSLGCIGNRVYTGLAEGEGYVALPASAIEAVTSRLAALQRANLELEKFHRSRQAAFSGSRTP